MTSLSPRKGRTVVIISRVDIRLIAEMIFRNEICMRPRRYLVLLTLLAGASIQAEPKDPPLVPPPMAQAQTVSIFRGDNIEVPLRAQGRAPSQLKFLIRSYPSKGRLGEIRLTGPKSAEVTYSHDGTSEGGDSFTFAVQAIDSPVSAAAPVTISISEEPPRLSVVKSVDFGTMEVGTTREAEITLRNSGGGELEGQMEVPPPWRIIGSKEYHLGRKQKDTVRVACAPSEPEEYAGKLAFSHDARVTVDLTAHAISPFELNPAREIELTSQNADPLRSADLAVRNRTMRDRTLRITLPAELAAPNSVVIRAGEEQKIALTTKPGFLGALETTLTLESEGFKQSLPVRVFSLPPSLQIEPREGLDFGEIEPRRRYRGFLRVKNRGGSPARLQTKVPSEVLLVPDPSSAVLQPGKTRVFEVAFEVSSQGSYRSEITISSNGAKPVTIPIVANTPPQAGEAKKIPTEALSSAIHPNPAASEAGPASGTPPAVKGMQILKAGNGVFEFGWQRPKSEPVAWIVQQRHLEITNVGAPKTVWRDLSNVRFFEQGNLIGARFENLAPGQIWFLRIISIDEKGRRSDGSPTFIMTSPPEKKQMFGRTLLVIFAVAAAVLGVFKFRQRRHAEAFEQAEQIARLEGR
jgi:HYDIN/CFA65/VesB family protein